jgi:2-oxoglutarate dehydrogenase complex dehydrogenase (E1) component-like enzyme
VSEHDVDALNAGYASALLEEYLENPESVPAEWRELFESGDSPLIASLPGLARLLERLGGNGNGSPVAAAARTEAPAEPTAPDNLLLGGVAAAMALVKAHRMHGHLAAHLDPLGSEPPGDPALEAERLIPPLTPELQARIPASLLRLYVPGETLADALPLLRETYCGTSAYEIEHISDHEERVWLRQAIESGRYRTPLSDDEKRRLLTRLSEVEGMERYLRRAFLGQKQFSIEGLDVMVPMLDEAIELGARAGAKEVVMGMAHRGRLNVLAHIVGRPYETILREFEGEKTLEAVRADPEGGSGDVKYHLGAEGSRTTSTGQITVTLAANPSHLEAVDPVVEGQARAEQTDRGTREGIHDPTAALPILLHGDAAFPGQGIVAETLNLANLGGYTTGGTLHLITNNQVGFTTDPAEGRSTRYSSDLAKGFDVPIIHVNADDAEAAIAAVRLALAFRKRFESDVVIDLVGYRRHGHNEQDEAAYTQPLMAAEIAEHPTVREQFAERLVEEGVVDQEEADGLARLAEQSMREAHERLKALFEQVESGGQVGDGSIPVEARAEVMTAVPADTLRTLNAELLAVPEDFTVHPKLWKQLGRRIVALEEGGIDWGQA